jgi:hypothetical protein
MSDMSKPQIPLPGNNPVKDNMSIMNPVDQAYMKQSGEFSPEMTVRDVLGKFGIDVDGPAQQLVDFGIKQVENADSVRKMQNIAGQGGQGGQMPPAPEQGMPQMPPEQGGLEGLLGINK